LGKWSGDLAKWNGDVGKESGDFGKWSENLGKWSGDLDKWSGYLDKWSRYLGKWSGDAGKWNDDLLNVMKPESNQRHYGMISSHLISSKTVMNYGKYWNKFIYALEWNITVTKRIFTLTPSC
jgi:hypothetical protein